MANLHCIIYHSLHWWVPSREDRGLSSGVRSASETLSVIDFTISWPSLSEFLLAPACSFLPLCLPLRHLTTTMIRSVMVPNRPMNLRWPGRQRWTHSVTRETVLTVFLNNSVSSSQDVQFSVSSLVRAVLDPNLSVRTCLCVFFLATRDGHIFERLDFSGDGILNMSAQSIQERSRGTGRPDSWTTATIDHASLGRRIRELRIDKRDGERPQNHRLRKNGRRRDRRKKRNDLRWKWMRAKGIAIK